MCLQVDGVFFPLGSLRVFRGVGVYVYIGIQHKQVYGFKNP